MRRGRQLTVGILAVLILAACSPTSGTVIGPVISVDGDLTEVRSFTVLVEGDEMVFVPIVEGDYAFPLPHLREHLRDGSPDPGRLGESAATSSPPRPSRTPEGPRSPRNSAEQARFRPNLSPQARSPDLCSCSTSLTVAVWVCRGTSLTSTGDLMRVRSHDEKGSSDECPPSDRRGRSGGSQRRRVLPPAWGFDLAVLSAPPPLPGGGGSRVGVPLPGPEAGGEPHPRLDRGCDRGRKETARGGGLGRRGGHHRLPASRAAARRGRFPFRGDHLAGADPAGVCRPPTEESSPTQLSQLQRRTGQRMLAARRHRLGSWPTAPRSGSSTSSTTVPGWRSPPKPLPPAPPPARWKPSSPPPTAGGCRPVSSPTTPKPSATGWPRRSPP